MVRWLEIKNQSDKPTAISRIFPWSGILFAEEQGFSLTTQEEAQRFYLGRYKNHHVLMEGEFFWQEITLGGCANARHACAEEIHSPEKQ